MTVFIVDLIVIFAFMCYLYFIERMVSAEAEKFDRYTFTITDFTLRIADLPPLERFGDKY